MTDTNAVGMFLRTSLPAQCLDRIFDYIFTNFLPYLASPFILIFRVGCAACVKCAAGRIQNEFGSILARAFMLNQEDCKVLSDRHFVVLAQSAAKSVAGMAAAARQNMESGIEQVQKSFNAAAKPTYAQLPKRNGSQKNLEGGPNAPQRTASGRTLNGNPKVRIQSTHVPCAVWTEKIQHDSAAGAVALLRFASQRTPYSASINRVFRHGKVPTLGNTSFANLQTSAKSTAVPSVKFKLQP